jgi:anthranilate phosphoribosyltransferase
MGGFQGSHGLFCLYPFCARSDPEKAMAHYHSLFLFYEVKKIDNAKQRGIRHGYLAISTETHGMSVRGGSVISQLKTGDFQSPMSHLSLCERRKTMIKEAIGKVVSKRDLTKKEMEEVMKEIIMASAPDAQIAAFITALRMKGETPEEIRSIKNKATIIDSEEDLVCLDREEITVERETILSTARELTEGTNIFNISTAAALVVAGGGLKVAKSGRRSSSPLCGCADVVETLGINLDMTTTQSERCLKEVGICFLYEPLAQNGLRHITTIREKIGIRTIFNILDPLINPARARFQVLGVYEPNLTETMATVLKNLGIKRGLVVHGEDTLDEISITGKTKITEFSNGGMKTYFIQPEDFGMEREKLAEIKGGTKKQNAEAILEILRGSRGAKRDITVLNAASAFMITSKAKDFNEGVKLANQSIDSGEAFQTLKKLIEFTNSERRYLRDANGEKLKQDIKGYLQEI